MREDVKPVAISHIFCPAESPGGAGGMSYTAARGILLQLTQLSRVLFEIRMQTLDTLVGMYEISVHRHTIPRHRTKKISHRVIPVICVAESPSGADPRRANRNGALHV